MPLSTGDIAPDFSLPDHKGETVSLSHILKDGPVVIFFYPKDETPGCTKQACSFRDHYERLVEEGLTVMGISRDSGSSHQSFSQNHNLPYPLLSDTDGKVHHKYGCLSMMGLLPRRVTYLIGEDRKIQLVHEDNFRMESHVEVVLGYIQDMGN